MPLLRKEPSPTSTIAATTLFPSCPSAATTTTTISSSHSLPVVVSGDDSTVPDDDDDDESSNYSSNNPPHHEVVENNHRKKYCARPTTRTLLIRKKPPAIPSLVQLFAPPSSSSNSSNNHISIPNGNGSKPLEKEPLVRLAPPVDDDMTPRTSTTTTTRAVLASPPRRPLKSCLKNPPTLLNNNHIHQSNTTYSSRTTRRHHQNNNRHVRGLWPDTSAFGVLDNGLLRHVLDFLSWSELVVLETSLRNARFRHVLQQQQPDSLWETVNATAWIQQVMHQLEQKEKDNNTPTTTTTRRRKMAQQETSLALCHVLRRHATQIKHLTIHHIDDKLLPDVVLPVLATLRNLQSLSVSHWDNLTNAHWHVLFVLGDVSTMSPPSPSILPTAHLLQPNAAAVPIRRRRAAAASSSSSVCHHDHQVFPNLRILQLHHCRQLSNDAIRSLANIPHLEELSLQHCHNVTRLEPLRFFTAETKTRQEQAQQEQTRSHQPAPTTPLLASLFAPPPTSPRSLKSLFSTTTTPRPQQQGLKRLDISYTNVTEQALQVARDSQAILVTTTTAAGTATTTTPLSFDGSDA